MFREQFFAIPPESPFEEVELPAGKVRVYALTAGEKDAFDIAHSKHDGTDFRARLVVATVRDDGGAPIFKDHDISRLSLYPLPSLEPMVNAAIRVNRMKDDEAEALAKN